MLQCAEPPIAAGALRLQLAVSGGAGGAGTRMGGGAGVGRRDKAAAMFGNRGAERAGAGLEPEPRRG